MSDKLSLKVTQASLNQTALDWPQNMANHYAAIDVAVTEGSDMVLMPELSLTGYEVNDDFQRTDNNRIYAALNSIAAYAHARDPNLIVSVGNPWRLQLRDAFEGAAANPDFVHNGLYDRWNRPYNVQTLITGGEILSMTAKANLYISERGYENRYFNQWSFRDVEEYAKLANIDAPYGTIPVTLPNGQDIPFGRPLIYVTDKSGHGYIHAQAICEEKWVATKYDAYPNDDSRYEQLNIIPSISRYLGIKQGVFLEIANASPPSREKQDRHMHLDELASRWADVVTDTDGLGTSGATFAQFGHQLVAQDGKTIAAGKRMGFGQIEATTSVVQIQNINPKEWGHVRQKTHAIIARSFIDISANPQADLVFKTQDSQKWDDPSNPDRWKEERIRNQALWMFDYMRKTGSKGIMEALSGGKDSSFNCAMVRVMVELAMHDLGVKGFCEQMPHLPYNDKILAAYKTGGQSGAVEECMSHMLTAVYMGTNNSSFETWNASKTLIDGGEYEDGKPFSGIGGKFVERNVQDLLDFYGYIFAVSGFGAEPSERKLEIIQSIQVTDQNLNDQEVERQAQNLYKLEIIDETAKFLNASPHDNTLEEMNAWADRLYTKYPEVEQLVSAALPGHGIGYENIQARGREVLIMLFANIEGKMAVANPNLDEAYGAYATFGGDLHSGTLNWNGGLHKSDQEALMDYLEDHGIPSVMDRVVSLALANKNKPSAELQPKEGDKVTQFDEDALQGTFPQKAALARLRHHTKIYAEHGERWMNAGELFDRAREDQLFSSLDDNQLFNAVVYFYQRWEGPAQHKIHATPIAPTFGENVDKQTSLRTPNLSGGSKDEIVQLGIDVLFSWAEEDGLGWDQKTKELLSMRAWQDKAFVQEFQSAIWNRDKSLPNMSFNLRGLYERIKEQGWDGAFMPLNDNHPAAIAHGARLEL